MHYSHSIGLTAGLLGALSWAIATVIFRQLGTTLHPLLLNLYKGIVAALVLLIVLLFGNGILQPIPWQPTLLLLVSGAIGIGIGDTAFFAALNRLGERKTVLLAETTAPLVTILLALLLFGELISPLATGGILLILAGLYLVVAVRENGGQLQSALAGGIIFALVAACCQAVGGVLSKGAFRMCDIDPLWSSLIRLLGGLLLLLLLIPLQRLSYLPQAARHPRVIRFVIIAALIGTAGGLTFQQAAYKLTYTALAQTLTATSSIFVLLIALMRGERPQRQAWLGALIATTGVALLFLFR